MFYILIWTLFLCPLTIKKPSIQQDRLNGPLPWLCIMLWPLQQCCGGLCAATADLTWTPSDPWRCCFVPVLLLKETTASCKDYVSKTPPKASRCLQRPALFPLCPRVPCATQLSHTHAHTLNKVYRQFPPSSFSFICVVSGAAAAGDAADWWLHLCFCPSS